MNSTTLKKSFVLLILASMTALVGCELIVDFDRTKILGEDTGEGGAVDGAPTTDTGAATDTGAGDSAVDSAPDAADAGEDVADAANDG